MSASNRILFCTALLWVAGACSTKQGTPAAVAVTTQVGALGTQGCGDASTPCGAWCFQVCGDSCQGAGAAAECAIALGLAQDGGVDNGCLRCQQGIERWAPVCAAPSLIPSCPDPDAGLFSYDSVDHLDDDQDAGPPITNILPDGGNLFKNTPPPYVAFQTNTGTQVFWTTQTVGSTNQTNPEYASFAFQAVPNDSSAGYIGFLFTEYHTQDNFDCAQPYTNVSYSDGTGNTYYGAAAQTDSSCSFTVVHRSGGYPDADELIFSAHLVSLQDPLVSIDISNALLALQY